MTMTAGAVTLTATQRVIFGRPAAEAVAEEAARLGAERVVLIASKSLVEGTDEIERIKAALGPRFAAVHSGIAPHVPRPDVVAAAETARAAKADLIVSVGGGSVTDCAKIVPILLKHDVTTAEGMEPFHMYVTDAGQLVKPDFAAPDVRVICVPTTLSGGEFNPLSGATEMEGRHKQGYEHRSLAPVSVILDPTLSRHTPDWLWFSTGVRSLDHAIEALASLQSNPYCDGLAESALRLLVEGLPKAKADPSDMEARLKVQIGVWQSMLPILAGVPMGASHAIGHVLGGLCDVPHGYTSCVMTPYVLRWNVGVNPERQRRIAACFGDPDGSAGDLADAFIRGLGMPRTLKEVGVGPERFEAISEYAMKDIWGRTNPRPITKPADVMELLQAAAG
jgi:maleylacetate reductase